MMSYDATLKAKIARVKTHSECHLLTRRTTTTTQSVEITITPNHQMILGLSCGKMQIYLEILYYDINAISFVVQRNPGP